MYIPDLTERYPEGFNGVDMFESYDPEYEMWAALEREYYENERRMTDDTNKGNIC